MRQCCILQGRTSLESPGAQIYAALKILTRAKVGLEATVHLKADLGNKLVT